MTLLAIILRIKPFFSFGVEDIKISVDYNMLRKTFVAVYKTMTESFFN